MGEEGMRHKLQNQTEAIKHSDEAMRNAARAIQGHMQACKSWP